MGRFVYLCFLHPIQQVSILLLLLLLLFHFMASVPCSPIYRECMIWFSVNDTDAVSPRNTYGIHVALFDLNLHHVNLGPRGRSKAATSFVVDLTHIAMFEYVRVCSFA